jgi:NTE family protein
MVEDIRRLCLENIKARKRSEAGGDADAESGGSKEVIPHLFVGPEDRSNIPLAAERLFAANHGTMCKFFSPLSILGRILGSQSRSRGELLSWLFFEPCFMQVLITMGAVDARNRLKRAKDLHAFPFGREPGEVERSFSQ